MILIRFVSFRLHLGELDVADSRINQQLDMLEEPLGVVSVPADDALSTSGMPREMSRIVFRKVRQCQASFVCGCSRLGVW